MINITNAELLSVNHTYQFWGDVFNYRNIQNLSIRGRILKTADSGIQQTWADLSGYIHDDFEQLVINGVNVGSGRITSINFEGGDHVRQLPYSIELELYKTGNLHNLTGIHYSGLSFNTGSLIFVNDLAETFDFNSDENGIYTYSRNLSFSVTQTPNNSTVAVAKSLATMFFDTDPVTQLLNEQYPNFYLQSGRKTHTESYDLYNHEFSFTENFTFDSNNPYVWTYTDKLNIGEDGIATLTEEGNLIGISSSPYQNALNGLTTISGGIFGRLSGLLNSYPSIYPSPCPIKNIPSKRSIVSNKCEGTIDYSFEYTNDPKLSESGYSWEYAQSIDRDGSIYTATEAGSIQGIAPTRPQAFSNAKSGFYNEIKSGIRPRILDAFSGLNYLLLNNSCTGDSSLKLITSSTDFSEYNGTFGYQYTYSTDPTLLDDANFAQVVLTTGVNTPVHIVNSFNIFNLKEIAQPAGNNSLGEINFNVNIKGKPGTKLQQYITKALTYISKPVSTTNNPIVNSDVFVRDISYDYEPSTNDFSLSITYAYNRKRTFKDILVW